MLTPMAVARPLFTEPAPPPGTRTCKNGHPVWGANEARVRHTSGRYYSACRRCRADAVQRVKARQRGEEVPLQAPTPVPKPEPKFATGELWKALPADLRSRVAGVILDPEPPDPLMAAVIRKAAKKRVWRDMPVAFAVIALVEALIEESREARSARLRLDRILRYALGSG